MPLPLRADSVSVAGTVHLADLLDVLDDPAVQRLERARAVLCSVISLRVSWRSSRLLRGAVYRRRPSADSQASVVDVGVHAHARDLEQAVAHLRLDAEARRAVDRQCDRQLALLA
jgi:hypothetical protein